MPALIAAYAATAALVATLWPLLTYSTSLALFGLGHVFFELRYIDARFGARLPARFWVQCAIPLALIVGLRLLRLVACDDAGTILNPLIVDGQVHGGLAAGVAQAVSVGGEMALVALLVAMAGPLAWSHARVVGVVGVVVAAVLSVATLRAPLQVLLTLAVLHNATPLGFVVERAPAGRKLRTLLLGALLFFGVPALVASGWPSLWLAELVDLDKTWLPSTGVLADHFAVYLWPSWRDETCAAQLFSAAVTAQLLHYAAVLFWLPRSLASDEAPTLPWPRPAVFVVVVGALTFGLWVHFTIDFMAARALYGLVAAVHAWIELPLFVVAFAVVPRLRSP